MRKIREKNINTADYFNDRFNENPDYYISPWKNLREYSRKFNLSIFEHGSILDYGCGDGKHLELYSEESGEKTAGVDISDLIIEKNKNKYEKSVFYVKDQMQTSGLKYDHVVTTHTIEHTDDPIEEVKNLMKIASNTLTIVVPYKNSWHQTEEHLWYFDRHSFDVLNPSLVRTGITNWGGNTEVIFHWNLKDKFHKQVHTIYPNYPFLLPMLYWFIRKNLPEDTKKYLKYFKFF